MDSIPVLVAFHEAPEIPLYWLIFGFCGQAMFFSRFAVQWIASERTGRSIVPIAFWWLSICGAAVLLTYFIFRRDPVGIVGQSGGFAIYLRNLILIKRERRNQAA